MPIEQGDSLKNRILKFCENPPCVSMAIRVAWIDQDSRIQMRLAAVAGELSGREISRHSESPFERTGGGTKGVWPVLTHKWITWAGCGTATNGRTRWRNKWRFYVIHSFT
jgi:hypothetical protein